VTVSPRHRQVPLLNVSPIRSICNLHRHRPVVQCPGSTAGSTYAEQGRPGSRQACPNQVGLPDLGEGLWP
jgi:hypothetical protein